jgi:hypothetical protein
MRYEDNEMVRNRGMKTTKRVMRERDRGQRGCGTCSTLDDKGEVRWYWILEREK